MFASRFSEGDTVAALRPDAHEYSRRIIRSEEDFEILHTVLYYLYTEKVYLRTDDTLVGPSNVPSYCDAEEIFAIAHRYHIAQLKQKALIFLRDTCNAENIVQRVFSELAILYDEVGEIYGTFFQRHWNEIRERKELDRYLESLEKNNSPRIWEVCKRLGKLVKGLKVVAT